MYKKIINYFLISLVFVFAIPSETYAWLPFQQTNVQRANNHHKHKKKGKHKKKHKKNGKHKKKPFDAKKFLEKNWSRGTFPTPLDSVRYHVNKHGNGRSATRYTKDAIAFYHKNYHRRKVWILHDGTRGYKIENGKDGGYWTTDGRIITFWG